MLRMYFDSACTNEITTSNPDVLHQTVSSGTNIVNVIPIWIKSDNNTVSYENISLTAQNVSGNIAITYAPDNNGGNQPTRGWLATLPTGPTGLVNGVYIPAVKVWRQIVITNITGAFKNDAINHYLVWDEYII